MSNPRNTEPQENGALARALMRRNPGWKNIALHAERTRVIQQAAPSAGLGKRADTLVAPPCRQPVVVETEFAPSHTVEQDATAQLGTSLHRSGLDIEGVLSVALPVEEAAQRMFDYGLPRKKRKSVLAVKHSSKEKRARWAINTGSRDGSCAGVASLQRAHAAACN